ncbi:protein kinase domain-containing protein [Actinoallomurus acaciae]|uniref:non-specific serine/threonine protein kinase n=1 Tax=Actinoallomurus acaciae TaxID=502577 RepID=A0ABV5YNE2_9ACTN
MREIAGRYRVDEEIGRGGMGAVWRAWDGRLHRHVAVKRLVVPAGTPGVDVAAMRSRFLREARAAAGLEHPAIIGVHDVVEEPDGEIWMVMELVRGRSLRDAAAGRGLPVEQVAGIGLSLLGALRAIVDGGATAAPLSPSQVTVPDSGGTTAVEDAPAAHADAVTVTPTKRETITACYKRPGRVLRFMVEWAMAGAFMGWREFPPNGMAWDYCAYWRWPRSVRCSGCASGL